MNISRHKTNYWIKNNAVDTSIKDIDGLVALHWHEFYEIEIIISGAGTYSIDGIDYAVEKGSLFFMSPSSCHTILFTDETRLINIMFVMDACEPDFLYDLFESAPHIQVQLNDSELEFLQTIAREMTETDELRYLTTMLGAVLSKIRKVFSIAEPSVKNSAMQYAVLYMQNHFKDNVRLSDVANTVSYSTNYFANKFKEYTGVPFKTYITNLQFAHVERLLKYTSFSITEICYQCGFQDFSNFMHYFKKRYGMTPKEYRLKNRC